MIVLKKDSRCMDRNSYICRARLNILKSNLGKCMKPTVLRFRDKDNSTLRIISDKLYDLINKSQKNRDKE